MLRNRYHQHIGFNTRLVAGSLQVITFSQASDWPTWLLGYGSIAAAFLPLVVEGERRKKNPAFNNNNNVHVDKA